MRASTTRHSRRPGRLAALGLAATALVATGLVGSVAVAEADGPTPARPDPTMTARAPEPTPQPLTPSARPPIGDRFGRTELFFGTGKPGPDVTDAQFKAFVNRVVTPRFPGGLTQYDALGQFRDSSGRMVKERSKVVILLYPAADGTANSVKIEEIRDIYEDTFEQESVLRADSVDLVSF